MAFDFTFERDLLHSFCQSRFYRVLEKKPLSSSLKFFLQFSFFYACFGAVILWLKLIPIIPNLQTIPSRLTQIFPSDLTIIVNQGQLTTNVDEPIYFSLDQINQVLFPARGSLSTTPSSQLNHLLVIDTHGHLNNFSHYSTYALLTQTDLIYLSPQSFHGTQLNRVSLSQLDFLHLNHTFIQALAQNLDHYTYYLPHLLIVAAFISLLIPLTIVRLIHILLLSLLFQLINPRLKSPFKPKHTFQITLHLHLIFVVLVSVFTLFAGPPRLPLATSLLTAVFYLIVSLNLIHTHPQPSTKTKK